jgi:hypothetical protein
VIEPYFFEENNQAVNVDSERYCTMLQTSLATELRRMRQRVRNVWFQQDDATNGPQGKAKHDFSKGNVSKPLNFTIWRQSLASTFPALDSPRLFSVGYLKSEVYATRPHSIQELKDRITEGIGTTDGALL